MPQFIKTFMKHWKYVIANFAALGKVCWACILFLLNTSLHLIPIETHFSRSFSSEETASISIIACWGSVLSQGDPDSSLGRRIKWIELVAQREKLTYFVSHLLIHNNVRISWNSCEIINYSLVDQPAQCKMLPIDERPQPTQWWRHHCSSQCHLWGPLQCCGFPGSHWSQCQCTRQPWLVNICLFFPIYLIFIVFGFC